MKNISNVSELRKSICEIFGVFPEELEFNLPGGIGTKKVEALEQLFQADRNKTLSLVEERVIGEDSSCGELCDGLTGLCNHVIINKFRAKQREIINHIRGDRE